GLVDYAGLFPPASEDMRTALENFASYREGDDRAALGRFIVPLSRLKELEDAGRDLMRRGDPAEPWPLSVLVAGDARSAAGTIAEFNHRHGPGSKDGRAVIDVAELKASTPEDIERDRAQLPKPLIVYFEIPIKGDVSPLVKAIARAGARAKVRTGGVTPESIPPGAEVVAFISACKREGVAFKATAGLHHPIRGSYRLTYEPNSPAGAMYGFLNVFVASALIYSGANKETAIAALEESDPSAFVFEDDAIVWRDRRITTDQIEASRRGFSTSFGSCSFREPVDELAAITNASRSSDQ
ncbi:MAG TPA: hypothetical protein VKB91_11670, partial [Gemmatimonadaceae bacterium]|nr:hypothetical protein [Gemmatimonadaceae bacterium]